MCNESRAWRVYIIAAFPEQRLLGFVVAARGHKENSPVYEAAPWEARKFQTREAARNYIADNLPGGHAAHTICAFQADVFFESSY